MENKKYVSLGNDFLLITTQYGGLDGVLFDDKRKDMPLDVTVNLLFLFLVGFILPISHWRGIVRTFEFCFVD